ncbi:MAG: efflux RND transporter periplasmic adaptor subunit [Tannerellaceae bacterium]|jgi:Cu(I)/Ag(I) efflux system membrane fusion protein|nr:efflux RND transporter periplasmic adaptor subunit [Tannerellaceae bacterium]
MKRRQDIQKASLIVLGGIAAGLLLGWWLFRSAPGQAGHTGHAAHTHAENEPQVWTCAMHPQIRQDKPGKCPLCAMDLIPVKTAGTIGETADPDGIMLSKEAMALANIRTTAVSRRNPVKEVRLYGTIQADERLSHSQVAHTGGRIERLFVNFTGETVRKGQTIASIYSPDLLNAQQELLEAAKIQSSHPAGQALLEAAREKLRLLKLTDSQIGEVEQSGVLSPLVNVVANAGGIVTVKKVAEGDYVNQGSVLFELTDLSTVWAMFDAYEADLPYLKTGDAVAYTLSALPGKSYRGKITFVDPVIDASTRTAKVRVETANPGLQLKPGMYANAVVEASMKAYAGSLVVPKTAVLWTGKRSIVYVKQPNGDMPVFRLREINLGAALGDAYVVLSGIDEGEEIVTNGVFSVDASAQLEGKRSMMNNDADDEPADGGEQATFAVRGLCEMCKERIESAAKGVKGVISAVWDMESGELRLAYDRKRTSPDAVAQAIALTGHDAGAHKAATETYNALPDCCKYRD